MSTKTDVEAIPTDRALPDLPGKVHGIKGTSPWAVQCDDCLTVFRGEFLLAVAQSAIFNQRSETPGLRLCMGCWEKRGWRDGYEGWTHP